MEPLKDQFFNPTIFKQFSHLLAQQTTGIDTDKMLKELTKDLDQYELKERLRNTTNILTKHLKKPYREQINVLWDIAPKFEGNFFGMIFPDFVEVNGQSDLETSYKALAHFTQFSSSEFAIRPFFKLDFVQTMDMMVKWSKNENLHVRRLASEGSRPRLPWSFQLKEVVENPELTLPILKNLKKDEKIYVKKSVANHLNDISKDHPKFLTKELSKWPQENPHTSWIIKQALRTLIKAGNADAMKVLGVNQQIKANVNHLELDRTKVNIGESLAFTFELSSSTTGTNTYIVDFAIHYMKNNGQTAPKVFKLKQLNLKEGEKIVLKKKIKFEQFSTRKHYSGQHQLEIFVNGISKSKKPFTLHC